MYEMSLVLAQVLSRGCFCSGRGSVLPSGPGIPIAAAGSYFR